MLEEMHICCGIFTTTYLSCILFVACINDPALFTLATSAQFFFVIFPFCSYSMALQISCYENYRHFSNYSWCRNSVAMRKMAYLVEQKQDSNSENRVRSYHRIAFIFQLKQWNRYWYPHFKVKSIIFTSIFRLISLALEDHWRGYSRYPVWNDGQYHWRGACKKIFWSAESIISIERCDACPLVRFGVHAHPEDCWRRISAWSYRGWIC